MQYLKKTYTAYIKAALTIGLILCTASFAFSSHIVGGEVTYKKLSGDRYEIQLQVFRDCINGNPAAYFDTPAYISIFDRRFPFATTPTDYLELFPLGDDTLNLTLYDSCLAGQPNVCIHTATYRGVIELPYSSAGYDLIYQRCCRNNIISNITNPGATGATYSTFLSPLAMQRNSSSPKFKRWPQFYICQAPINLDQSAIDPDSDSLVYSLCAPYEGATSNNPSPQPPTVNPGRPYTFPLNSSVTWGAGYSLTNMLGNPSAPLVIDPQTGQLSGTPANLGTYVIGLCVSAYDRTTGQFIETTRRDFQFTVAPCQLTVAADFTVTPVNCLLSPTVSIKNNSSNPFNTYSWALGDGKSTSTSSPVHFHRYDSNGTYTITLTAAPGEWCKDTITKTFDTRTTGVNITTSPPLTICKADTLLVFAQNISPDTSIAIQYNWSDTANIISGNGSNRILYYANSSTVIQVRAVNDSGCIDIDRIPITIDYTEAAFDTVPSDPCDQIFKSNFINQSLIKSDDFSWSFDGIGTSTQKNPTFNFPGPGTYTITLFAGPNKQCKDTISKTITLADYPINIEGGQREVICKFDSVKIGIQSDTNYTDLDISWYENQQLIDAGLNLDTLILFGLKDQIYDIIARNSYGCTDSTQVQINTSTKTPVLTVSSSADSIFKGESVTLTGTINSNYIYEWLEDKATLSSLNTAQTTAKPRTDKIYILRVENGLNCINYDTVRVGIKASLCGPPMVFIPNTFTPNKDGVNDVLYVRGDQVTEMELKIYDRWGKLVFESNDPSIGWDGTIDGKPAPPVVYGYYLRTVCEQGYKNFMKGNINLIR